ncbi:MAG TPA: xanthine dehydrogenase family protein molybdopterin-binding subunit [Terriglobales bacterium]|nr:xanthine dehydrogenase family protein molybdopterin-binding subunit [Terriglobales bacterium]
MSATRREFLKTTAIAGAGLVIAFHLPAHADEPAGFDPNAYISIHSDNTVHLWITRSEMGQGVRTTLPMMLNEELDADWAQIRYEQATPGGRFGGIRLRTSGSGSTAGTYKAMCKAGATAREMLIAAAAQRWNVDTTGCVAHRGVVHHTSSGRKFTYGQLAIDAAKQKVPNNPPLRSPKDFQWIGTRVKRTDGVPIVSGRATYGIDVRVPGMLQAVVARCPYFGGKLISFDSAKTMKVPGVRHVVPVTTGIAAGVAVVADHTWAAMKGRDVLQVQWERGPHADFDSSAFLRQMEEKLAGKEDGYFVRGDGNAAVAIQSAAQKLDAVYEFPFQAHAPLETMNCVADVRSGSCEVWVPTQAPEVALAETAKLLGIPESAVAIHVTLLGGGFGRRLFADYVPEAVEISRAVGKPVQLLWTRSDDMRFGFFHPADIQQIRGGLDAAGKPVAWIQRSIGSDLSMFGGVPEEEKKNPRHYFNDGSPWGSFDNPYNFPHLKADFIPLNSPVPTGPWRAVEYPPTVFARESFIDEMAHAAGKDPLQFRLDLLKPGDVLTVGESKIDRARLLRVLQLAAEKASWSTPLASIKDRVRGRGIACNVYSEDCYIAQVAEVSIGKQKNDIRVHRVVCAVDCGLVINPQGLEGQAESGILWGLSAALHGGIDFKNGTAVQENYSDFEVIRIDEAPEIETHIVPSGLSPGGFGETAVPPIAPAVANAIFAATGKRVRRLPITPKKLMSV